MLTWKRRLILNNLHSGRCVLATGSRAWAPVYPNTLTGSPCFSKTPAVEHNHCSWWNKEPVSVSSSPFPRGATEVTYFLASDGNTVVYSVQMPGVNSQKKLKIRDLN